MEWIKCSERLPERDTRVLVASAAGLIYVALHYPELGYWGDTDGGWFEDGCITHWMPLPDPPQ